MISEELELNRHLETAGIRAVETDLGEYLVQLAGQRPVHIVTPALHLSAADAGRLFADKLGEPFTAEHRELTNIARKHLRQEYLRAEMGISGVNFAIADTGTIVIVENEGNAGLSTAAPKVHVALMGIEKVIPRIDHLPVFLNLLARSGTGQKLTTYTHLIHGATPGRKLYVIILDNGRSNVLKDPAARMALYCIRCGSCLNACPVYRRTGGWAYGWVYPGPIGSILTPHLLGARSGRGAAVCLVAVRRVRRDLPGEDRHPPPVGPPAAPRRQRALADELVDGAADVEDLGLVHEGPGPLPDRGHGDQDRRVDAGVCAAATARRQTPRLDPRPGFAAIAGPGTVSHVVAAKGKDEG